MAGRTQIFLIAALTLGCCALPAHAADGDWEHTVLIYGMGAAIDGEAQIGDIKVPVDLSIGDVFDALEMGAMAAYRADNGTWSITADATFMGLGGTAESNREILKGDLDMDQTTFMGTLGRRLTPSLEALFTLAYVDLSTDLKVTARLPGGGSESRKASSSASWIDPLVGLQYNMPLADAWRFNLRGDVGGFGVGSDFTYQVLANFRYQANDRLGVVFGYRLIGFDYEDGHGSDYERYDLTEQGPLVGVAISF